MNIPLHFFNSNLDNPKLFNIKKADKWHSISGDDFLSTVKFAHYGLMEFNTKKKWGIKKRSPVGLIATSSPTWVILNQTIMASKLVPVPMFVNVSQKNLSYQIKEPGIRTVFIAGEEALKTITPILRKLKNIIYTDIDAKKLPKSHKKKFTDYNELVEKGKELLAKKPKLDFISHLKTIKANDVAVMIYTSGSTGEPKGVILTHKNLLHQIKAADERFPLIAKQDTALSCLPLAHIFEHTIINLFISQNLNIYFSPNLTQLAENIREVRPTVMTVVPRILVKVYEKMSMSYLQQKGWKRTLVEKATRYAQNTSLPVDSRAKSNHAWYYPIFEKLVYSKFRKALGDNFKVLVNGGAALPGPILRFFRNIGINVVEGYGLTETSPVIAANHLSYHKPYSVGPLFKDVQVKIVADEIWTKSPAVMKGYYKKPKLTKKVLTKDGWFKTGDLGYLDNQKNLTITGRKKDLYKLSNGKYVAPIPIEQKLEMLPAIDTAMLIADDQKFVSALLFMNMDLDITNKEECEEKIAKHIKQINSQLNSWEKVIRFKVIWKRLSIEEGEITPKMNIRRAPMHKKYEREIKALYK